MSEVTVSKLTALHRDKTLMHQTGVYKIFHLANPCVFYIGSASNGKGRKYTTGFYKRWSTHLYHLRNRCHHSQYLMRIVDKYGIEGVRFTVLKVCDTKESILQAEQMFIDHLSPKLNGTKSAFNSSGYRHSEESLIKMRSQRTGKRKPMSESTKKIMSEYGKKRDLSYLRKPEVLAKKRASSIGGKRPSSAYDAVRKKVFQFTLEGLPIKEYVSIAEASRQTNVDIASINHCASGNRGVKTAGGFLWSFNSNVKPLQKKRLIVKMDMEGTKLNEYHSIQDIVKEMNLSSGTAIRNCFSGRQKQAYGFKWQELYNNHR